MQARKLLGDVGDFLIREKTALNAQVKKYSIYIRVKPKAQKPTPDDVAVTQHEQKEAAKSEQVRIVWRKFCYSISKGK